MKTSPSVYAEHLQRRNTDAIGFIPRSKLREYEREGRILLQIEGGDPCGFLVMGAGDGGIMRVFQACVDLDARRLAHATALVDDAERLAAQRECTEIRLRCRSRLPANHFWVAAGYEPVDVTLGGARRGDMVVTYAKTIASPQGVLPFA